MSSPLTCTILNYFVVGIVIFLPRLSFALNAFVCSVRGGDFHALVGSEKVSPVSNGARHVVQNP